MDLPDPLEDLDLEPFNLHDLSVEWDAWEPGTAADPQASADAQDVVNHQGVVNNHDVVHNHNVVPSPNAVHNHNVAHNQNVVDYVGQQELQQWGLREQLQRLQQQREVAFAVSPTTARRDQAFSHYDTGLNNREGSQSSNQRRDQVPAQVAIHNQVQNQLQYKIQPPIQTPEQRPGTPQLDFGAPHTYGDNTFVFDPELIGPDGFPTNHSYPVQYPDQQTAYAPIPMGQQYNFLVSRNVNGMPQQEPLNDHHHMPQTSIARPPDATLQQRQNVPAPFNSQQNPQPSYAVSFANGHQNIYIAPQTGATPVTSPESTHEVASAVSGNKRRKTDQDDVAEDHSPGPQPQPRDPLGFFTQASGPMSQDFTIRPRPKPGRKPKEPIEEEGATQGKRRGQNREAQRRFREKYAQKVAQLEFNVAQVTNELKQTTTALHQRDGRIADLEHDLAVEKAKLRQLQGSPKRSDSISTDGNQIEATRQPRNQGPQHEGPRYGNLKFAAPLTPPDNHANEIDFTNFGRTVLPTHPHSSDSLGPSGLGDDRCGFCTDAQNCLCKQDSAPVPEIEGPGNCAPCIADPQRAQACRQLAASANIRSFGFRPLHGNDGNGVGGGLGNSVGVGGGVSGGFSLARSDSYHSGRISCEQLMDRAKDTGTRLASIAELFPDQIKAYPTASGRYEVEEHEAAQALQTLSKQTTNN